jgi:hypothetical protein
MHVEATVLFVPACVAVLIAVRWIAERTGLPAAALLILIAVAHASAPGPTSPLDPDLVPTPVIPPLLCGAAPNASRSANRRTLRTVVRSSVLLVPVTSMPVPTPSGGRPTSCSRGSPADRSGRPPRSPRQAVSGRPCHVAEPAT